MSMLKHELDPFEKVPWYFLWKELAWYVRYFSTSPALRLGKLLLRFGNGKWSKYIREGLTYKPSDPGTLPIQQLPRHQQYWAKIITRRQPMPPAFHPTVWFNAWKFSQEEQIWAALATEVLNQLDKKYPWPLRFIFKFRLMRERSTPWRAVGHVALNLLPAVLIGLSYILYNAYLLPYVAPFLTVHLLPLFQTLLSWFPHANSQAAAAKTANSAGVVVWTIAAATALVTKFKRDKINPFKIPLKDLFDPPKYEEKIGFIGQFEEDFGHIVNVITQHFSKAWEPRKLVIFIDDLDRCRPPQVVSIIEAISLFLDSKQCVFVIGMDPAAIVTSIEDKYKDLVAKMRKEIPGIVAPGSLFLDKIIQIPFNIPRPTPEDISFLVEEIMYSKDKQSSAPSLVPDPSDINSPSPPPPRDGTVADIAGATVDVGSFERVDVQDAIKTASSYLKGNPRMVKRFINLFRLKVYLADKLTLLRGQSLTPLAILVVWSMRWPEVTKLLLDEAHNSDVSIYLAGICNYIEEGGEWKVSTSTQGDQPVTTLEYDRVLSDLEDRRKQAENFPAHWCRLPWEEWMCDKGFRCCIKHMEKEQLWRQLQAREDTQVDSTLDLVNS
jgi:KAP family P-loop domain